ncbi:hypothetical protein [Clostridium estertheticum]|uniref:hypothetical protein n=1 Tax=Clostridium estertheticum TaxID=238834 RepID=UPI001CF3C0FE|nr:hypothetical protein [Clostridium estertheticum]MCB2357344.1 hypothetical protein [Clostridium estertheticum]WAG41407.1 hypothetical protein LL065_01365 [Clostridium estertheticum]
MEGKTKSKGAPGIDGETIEIFEANMEANIVKLRVKLPWFTYFNIYVKSKKAENRVMDSITRFIEEKLKFKVNKEKSIVDRPWNIGL